MIDLSNADLFRTQGFIDGAWMNAANGNTFTVFDPATQDVVAEVANFGAEETRAAIAAAKQTQKTWRATPAKTRAQILRRWHNLIIANSEDLAKLLTLEQGKPLAEARGEIAYGASFVEWFAEEAKRIDGDVIQAHANDRKILTFKEPVGVVAAITPWNFPNAMITRKVAPALAAGCTVIIKPSEETPLSALALAELADKADMPAGVLNILTTDDASSNVKLLTDSPDVRKLSFTGSTEVGKLLMRQCADTVKKISLELGGNAPFIVFDDADLDAAVEGAIASKYRNAGQTCVCANRFLVQHGVREAFAEKLAKRAGEMKVASGFEDGAVIGPLINEEGAQKVRALVDDARAKGAQIVGGDNFDEDSLFISPMVLSNVTLDMRIVREEIFGPVAPIVSFTEEAEAIEIANNTPFGLAAYFYTRDASRMWRVSEALEYGIVGVNEGIISSEVAPFGGVKESGIGREGSKYGIDEFLEIKYVCMGGLEL